MDDRSRRRVLAATGATLVTVLAGCATGSEGTSTDGVTKTDTETTTVSTTVTSTRPATTQETTTESTTRTTTQETTTTAESTTQTATEPTTETATETATETTTQTTTQTATRTTVTGPAVTVSVGPSGDLVFDPDRVTVSVGATVEWRWDSGGHNIVVENQPESANWEGTAGTGSRTFDEGHTHSFTFEVAGTYEYYCAPHQTLGMRGTVVVE